MKEKKKIPIGFAVKLFSIIAFLSMLAVILYLSFTANNSLKNQTARLGQSTLTSFCDQVERSLTELDKYLYNTLHLNSNVSMLEISGDDQEQYQAMVGISDSLSQLVSLHDLAEGVFFYSPEGTQKEIITRTSNVLSLGESKAIQSTMMQMIESDTGALNTTKWYLGSIEDKTYFLRILKTGASYYGAWVSAERIESALKELEFGEENLSVLCYLDGMPMTGNANIDPIHLNHQAWGTISVDGRSMLQISVQSDFCNFAAATFTPLSEITEEWNDTLTFVWIFAIMFFIILLVFIFSSNYFYYPFRILVDAMRKVEQSNFDVKITNKISLKEFDQVYTIFNSMVVEIKKLKIDVYEQEIHRQKITQQFLQIQLKSHFYLNCLNIIYSLAQVQDYALIQQLTLCLVKYFRYMMQDTDNLPTVREEMEHIRNYMHIQQLRFADLIQFDEEIDERCLDIQVPSLMLHTFIENSIEHGIDFDQINEISISIQPHPDEENHSAIIIIQDNGAGFSADQLDALNRPNPTVKTSYHKGLGIHNMKDRLRLLYEEKADIHLDNAVPHGAKIEIQLPVVSDEKGKVVQNERV